MVGASPGMIVSILQLCPKISQDLNTTPTRGGKDGAQKQNLWRRYNKERENLAGLRSSRPVASLRPGAPYRVFEGLTGLDLAQSAYVSGWRRRSCSASSSAFSWAARSSTLMKGGGSACLFFSRQIKAKQKQINHQAGTSVVG